MEAVVVEALIEIEADEMIEELEEQHIRYVDLWLVDLRRCYTEGVILIGHF